MTFTQKLGYVGAMTLGVAGVSLGVHEAMDYARDTFSLQEATVPLTFLTSAALGGYGLQKIVSPIAKKVAKALPKTRKGGSNANLTNGLYTAGIATLVALTPLKQGTELFVNGALHTYNCGYDALNRIGNTGITHTDIRENIKKHSKYSTEGKCWRTVRYHHFIESAAHDENIPSDKLAGLIMQESYGEPLQLNSSGDGGAGLCQFQPGTAQQFGLKTYGTSTAKGRDKVHGAKLVQLVKNNSPGELAELDDRFNPEKAIDATAEYLRHNMTHFKCDINGSLSAYNQGTPAKNPANTKHVKGVLKEAKAYKQFLRDHQTNKGLIKRLFKLK